MRCVLALVLQDLRFGAADVVRHMSRQGEQLTAAATPAPRNPLDLRAALLFASIFLAMLVATKLAATHLGHRGLYGLAGVMGISDVDPFIMGLTQSAGGVTPLHAASVAVLLAAASNNLVKGIYAKSFGSRECGNRALTALAILAALGAGAVLFV